VNGCRRYCRAGDVVSVVDRRGEESKVVVESRSWTWTAKDWVVAKGELPGSRWMSSWVGQGARLSEGWNAALSTTIACTGDVRSTDDDGSRGGCDDDDAV